MDNLIITRADINEAELLTNLSVTTFRDAFTAGNMQEDMDKYIADEMNLDKLTEELDDKENIFFIAWHNALPIGYAKLRAAKVPQEPGSNNAIELERLYVLQSYQSKKYGDAIMNHCIKHAKSRNYDIMWLGVWEHNHGAKKFYRTYGFELFGVHIFMLGNDPQRDVLMKKAL